jgi:hypothetical protein
MIDKHAARNLRSTALYTARTPGRNSPRFPVGGEDFFLSIKRVTRLVALLRQGALRSLRIVTITGSKVTAFLTLTSPEVWRFPPHAFVYLPFSMLLPHILPVCAIRG